MNHVRNPAAPARTRTHANNLDVTVELREQVTVLMMFVLSIFTRVIVMIVLYEIACKLFINMSGCIQDISSVVLINQEKLQIVNHEIFSRCKICSSGCCHLK